MYFISGKHGLEITKTFSLLSQNKMHENDKIKSTYVKALYIMRLAIIMAVFNAIILVFLLMTMYKAAKSLYTGETSGLQIETHTGTDPEASIV